MPYGNNNYGGGRPSYNGGNHGGFPQNSNSRTNSFGPSINSTGPTLTNEAFGKYLNCNYFNRYVSLEIGSVPAGTPITWEAKRTGQRVTQILDFGELSDLYDICEEVLDSIKNAGTFTNTGVRVGSKQDAIVEINNGSNLGNGPGIYLVFYKNIDPSNRPGQTEIYAFNNSKIIRGYDFTTGTAKEDISKTGQFKKFMRMIKEGMKALTMAQAHSNKIEFSSDRLTAFKTLGEISTKLGISMSAELNAIVSGQSSKGSGAPNRPRQSSNNFGGQRNNYGNQGYNRPYNNTPAQNLPSVDDPIDLNLSLDNLTQVSMEQFKNQ